jgi:hypothetical protein
MPREMEMVASVETLGFLVGSESMSCQTKRSGLRECGQMIGFGSSAVLLLLVYSCASTRLRRGLGWNSVMEVFPMDIGILEAS